MATTRFLNLDLDLEAEASLQPIVDAWRDRAYSLREGLDDWPETSATFELDGSSVSNDPDALLAEFCDLVEQLPEPARRLWDEATKRDFNFGFDSGLEPHWSHWTLSAESVARVAAIGGSITMTVYAVPPDDLAANESPA